MLSNLSYEKLLRLSQKMCIYTDEELCLLIPEIKQEEINKRRSEYIKRRVETDQRRVDVILSVWVISDVKKILIKEKVVFPLIARLESIPKVEAVFYEDSGHGECLWYDIDIYYDDVSHASPPIFNISLSPYCLYGVIGKSIDKQRYDYLKQSDSYFIEDFYEVFDLAHQDPLYASIVGCIAESPYKLVSKEEAMKKLPFGIEAYEYVPSTGRKGELFLSLIRSATD